MAAFPVSSVVRPSPASIACFGGLAGRGSFGLNKGPSAMETRKNQYRSQLQPQVESAIPKRPPEEISMREPGLLMLRRDLPKLWIEMKIQQKYGPKPGARLSLSRETAPDHAAAYNAAKLRYEKAVKLAKERMTKNIAYQGAVIKPVIDGVELSFEVFVDGKSIGTARTEAEAKALRDEQIAKEQQEAVTTQQQERLAAEKERGAAAAADAGDVPSGGPSDAKMRETGDPSVMTSAGTGMDMNKMVLYGGIGLAALLLLMKR